MRYQKQFHLTLLASLALILIGIAGCDGGGPIVVRSGILATPAAPPEAGR